MKLLTALLLAAFAGLVQAAGAEPLWTLKGFEQPESALYVARQDVIYVSNVNGADDARDGNGYISQVSTSGKLIKKRWKTGLNAPKGLGFKAGLLYVADLDELLEIDTGNLRVLRRFKGEGAKFFNDVTVSGDVVYVSDMVTNVVWRLFGDSFTKFVADPALENPNGLLAEKGQLLVASWGVMKPDFSTEVTGHLLSIDLGSRTVSSRFAPLPLGNLDGLIADGAGGYIVSDYMAGNIFRVSAKGEVNLWLPLEKGTADLGAIPGKAVLIPNLEQGSLTAYPFPK